jgi:hypothetical protein
LEAVDVEGVFEVDSCRRDPKHISDQILGAETHGDYEGISHFARVFERRGISDLCWRKDELFELVFDAVEEASRRIAGLPRCLG